MEAIVKSQYMSYEATRLAAPPRIESSPDLRRIYWPLQGTFPSALAVMKTRRSALEEMEPLVSEDGTWHEILSQSMFEPKVSYMDVVCEVLVDYEINWGFWHTEEEHASAELVAYSDLDPEVQTQIAGTANQDDNEYLMRCCGQDRPMNKHNKSLRVTPSINNEFVTIFDYVSGML